MKKVILQQLAARGDYPEFVTPSSKPPDQKTNLNKPKPTSPQSVKIGGAEFPPWEEDSDAEFQRAKRYQARRQMEAAAYEAEQQQQRSIPPLPQRRTPSWLQRHQGQLPEQRQANPDQHVKKLHLVKMSRKEKEWVGNGGSLEPIPKVFGPNYFHKEVYHYEDYEGEEEEEEDEEEIDLSRYKPDDYVSRFSQEPFNQEIRSTLNPLAESFRSERLLMEDD